MIVIIKTKKESTIRVLLKLLEDIRYHNLYTELEEMKKWDNELNKK